MVDFIDEVSKLAALKVKGLNFERVGHLVGKRISETIDLGRNYIVNPRLKNCVLNHVCYEYSPRRLFGLHIELGGVDQSIGDGNFN